MNEVSRCRNKKYREMYTLLMDYFAEDSAIVGDSEYAPAIPSITCSLHGDVRPIAI
jgi:hypothetical protein